MDYAIKGVKVNKKYGDNVVLKNSSFSIYDSEIYGLIGKNGSGKTTLLKIISHIVPTNKFGGKIIYKTNQYRDIGSLIEDPNLFKDLSVMQNLRIYSYLYSKDKRERKEEIIRLIRTFELKEFIHKKIYNLSLGMTQKVRIAVSFFTKSKIIILDEPFNGLDIDGVVCLRNYIEEYVKFNKKTLIITSHNTDEMYKICDKFGILHKGKIYEKAKKELINKGISLEELYLKCLRS